MQNVQVSGEWFKIDYIQKLIMQKLLLLVMLARESLVWDTSSRPACKASLLISNGPIIIQAALYCFKYGCREGNPACTHRQANQGGNPICVCVPSILTLPVAQGISSPEEHLQLQLPWKRVINHHDDVTKEHRANQVLPFCI